MEGKGEGKGGKIVRHWGKKKVAEESERRKLAQNCDPRRGSPSSGHPHACTIDASIEPCEQALAASKGRERQVSPSSGPIGGKRAVEAAAAALLSVVPVA